MYSLSYIIKYLLGLISSSETIKNGNKIEQLINEEIEAYVGGDSYLNYFYKRLPPKIGFHKETTIQPWSKFSDGKTDDREFASISRRILYEVLWICHAFLKRSVLYPFKRKLQQDRHDISCSKYRRC